MRRLFPENSAVPEGPGRGTSVVGNHLSDMAGGVAVQARDVHGDIHVHGPLKARVLPRQLPRGPERLIDRKPQQTRLNRLPADATVVITGAGGVGKTTLALAWLHRISGRYPDGQLFADLRGQSRRRVGPTQVLEEWLRALGVSPEQIPTSVSKRATLFRSATAGRRMAVLVDNATSTSQVRPLLPGPGCLMVITSRRQLAGLVISGARSLVLDRLDAASSLELLEALIGPERVRVEVEHARSLTAFCSGLPLAIAVTAATLATHPHWPIARLTRDLTLSALDTDDGAMTEIFDSAYQSLPDDATRRLYRLLPLNPGRDITADAAAALADTTTDAAARQLRRLADAHLVEERDGGRYSFHDLLREHARAIAKAHEAEDDPASAFVCLAYWRLRVAAAAQRAVVPGRWYIGHVFTEPPEVDFDDESGLEWLDNERHNLLATMYAAHERGLHSVTWQIAEAMWGLFVRRRHFGTWMSTYEIGAKAARAAGDPVAEARMLHGQAAVYLAMRHYRRAVACANHALKLAQDAGHRMAVATSLEQLGLADLAQGDPDCAAGRILAARDIHDQLGHERGVALMIRHLGEVATAAGNYGQAIEHLTAAEQWFASQPDEKYLWSRCLRHLGEVYRLAERPEDASTVLHKALDLARTTRAHQQQAEVLVELATLATDLGNPDLTQRHLREAYAIYEELGAPEAATIAARLRPKAEGGA